MQETDSLLLIRPARFGFNTETAVSNAFQQELAEVSLYEVQQKAQVEFEAAVARLRAEGVRVLVMDDTPEPPKPDAVFPNNWLTLHADGRVVLYPMCAPNRRAERRPEILDYLRQQFAVRELLDFTAYEQQGKFLEGTGSLIFDHQHRIAYACESPRTHPEVVREVCQALGYRPVIFRAWDARQQLIYHTNVMMCVGSGFAVICLESIAAEVERREIVASLKQSGHELVEISLEQVAQFAGNMLGVKSVGGEALLVLSQTAYQALTESQRATLAQYVRLVCLPIPTIETIGGGSARCMLAEVFLPGAPAEKAGQ